MKSVSTSITLNVDTWNQSGIQRGILVGRNDELLHQLLFSGGNKAAERQTFSQQEQNWFFLGLRKRQQN